MKKTCLILFTAVLLIVTGCKKASTNKLLGFWSKPVEYVEGYVEPHINVEHLGHYCRNFTMEFVNSNTLYNYNYVADRKSAFEAEESEIHSVPGKSGWYYKYRTQNTYVFEDNKVILSNGDIYTYMDGKLYLDGYSSVVLSPW